MKPEHWSIMMADPRWKDVAERQARAWERFTSHTTEYQSGDIEETYEWQQARQLAATIEQEYATQ